MPTPSAVSSRLPAIRRSALECAMVVLGAITGVCLGCAGATPKDNVWFDACCDTCSEDHCEECTQAKGGCGGKLPDHEAECMMSNGMMMCRPPPEARH